MSPRQLNLISEVDPTVLVLLSGRDVPPAMLGIDQVEVGADEPVLLQGADAGKIGVILENIDRF